MRSHHMTRIALQVAMALACYGLNNRPLVAADKKEVIIKSSETVARSVQADGEIEGKPVRLACMLSHSDCEEIKPGKYVMVESDKGTYTDCPNVDIYRKSNTRNTDEKKVGRYCLMWNDPKVAPRVEVPSKSSSDIQVTISWD